MIERITSNNEEFIFYFHTCSDKKNQIQSFLTYFSLLLKYLNSDLKQDNYNQVIYIFTHITVLFIHDLRNSMEKL